MKLCKSQNPLRQITLDEFTGGDMLVGVQAAGPMDRTDRCGIFAIS